MMSTRQTLKDEVKNFTDNWSGHGVQRVAISGNIVKKLFYTGVFITCVTLFAYQFCMLFRKYYSYPVNTVIKVHHDTLRFPAVTICNKNVVRNSKLSLGGSVLQAVVSRSQKIFRNVQKYNFNNVIGDGVSSGPGGDSSGGGSGIWSGFDWFTYPTIYPFKESSANMKTEPSEHTLYQPPAVPWMMSGIETGHTAQDVAVALMKVNISWRLAMGHQLSEMLQSCSINGETCSTEDFTAFFNVLYGNCYTFNGMMTSQKVRTFQSGPMFGLNMDLVIEQDEYIASLSKSAGIRLTVHDPYDFPFPEDNGIDLAPGKTTSVGLKLKIVEKLGPPFSKCTDGRGMKTAYRGHYTVEACRKTCLQHRIIQTCNCSDTRYSNINFDNARPCDNPKDYDCITDTKTEYHRTDNCECPAACKMNVYQQTISSADFPSMASQDVVENIIMDRSTKLKSTLSTGVEKNLLQVQVYFESLQYEKILEQEAYDFEALLSDVGGQAGLLIGWSVISFVEIFEFVGNLIWIAFKSLLARRVPTSGRRKQVSPVQ